MLLMKHDHVSRFEAKTFRIGTQKTLYVDIGQILVPVLLYGLQDSFPYPCRISYLPQGNSLGFPLCF